MGSTRDDRQLVVHLESAAHRWDLPYLNLAKAREWHAWHHLWGVPAPESDGPWGIYLDSGAQPKTVWD